MILEKDMGKERAILERDMGKALDRRDLEKEEERLPG